MQIKLSEQNTKKQNVAPQFKGVGMSCGLHFLNHYPAIGALFVDAGSMGAPRTIIDSFRGPDAAKETAIREFGSTINFSFIGLWCALASTLCGAGFKRHYNDAHAEKILANSSTIDVMSKMYNNSASGSKSENADKFAREFCNSIQTLNGGNWVNLEKNSDTDAIVKELAEIIKESKFNSKIDKPIKRKITTMITAQTGAGQNARLKMGKTAVEGMSVSDCVEHFVSLGRTFVHATTGELNHDFVKRLKNNKIIASLAGIAVPLSIAVSVQPINRYLTKKRTGHEGFVGVQGEQADNSKYFKYEKAGLAALFSAATIATIGKNVLNKLQFSSFVPNLSQFKLIYGLTIGSRLLVARDKNELRETCIKDSLGFANWLIVGGFVSKLLARGLDKNVINYDKSTLKKNAGPIAKAWHWITNASIKSTEEVLVNDMKKAGLDIMKDGKAKSFKELLKDLPENMSKTRAKIKVINKSQLAGYIYSMVALGFGVTAFNMFMTNYLVKKHKKTDEKQPQAVINAQKNVNSNIQPINPYFMSDKVLKDIKKAK